MSAVLRASGDDFDVESYLCDCGLPGVTSFKRGELKFPRSKPNGPRREWSGITAEASAADFDEFPQQVADATAFLGKYANEVRHLRSFPGVEGVTLDFAIWRRDVAVQCDHFSEELVKLAGELGVGLELSVYSQDIAADG